MSTECTANAKRCWAATLEALQFGAPPPLRPTLRPHTHACAPFIRSSSCWSTCLLAAAQHERPQQTLPPPEHAGPAAGGWGVGGRERSCRRPSHRAGSRGRPPSHRHRRQRGRGGRRHCCAGSLGGGDSGLGIGQGRVAGLGGLQVGEAGAAGQDSLRELTAHVLVRILIRGRARCRAGPGAATEEPGMRGQRQGRG
jgi:hypothetical protein